jgi:hypothetical protein
MPSTDLLALARAALPEASEGRAESAQSAASPDERPLSSLSSLFAQPRSMARSRCWTCGEPATGTWDDGSPRFDHGHDRSTGVRWVHPRSRVVRLGTVRTCPACATEHAVGTTCGSGTDRAKGERSAKRVPGP